jgi:hypothetical protein
MLKDHIDHNYICQEILSDCIGSELVASTNTNLKDIPATLFEFRYTFSDGYVRQSKVWVSSRNIFEGVLEYETRNAQTSKLRGVRRLVHIK